MLEHYKALAEHSGAGALQGCLATYRRLGHVAYLKPVTYAIRAVRDIAGTTQPSTSTSDIKQNIDRGDFFNLKQPYHCYQFLKRPHHFEKETQKRPSFFIKRDLKETFDTQKKRPSIKIFFFSCHITFE